MLQTKWIVGGAASVTLWSVGGFVPLDHALQAVYDSILSVGMPYLSNFVVEATIALVAWFVSCMYFTYLDVTRSPTKVQKDYWPTTKEMLECAIPQIVIYTLGCSHTWYLWATDEQYTVVVPSTAPTFAEFCLQMTVSLIFGDFLMYWQHRWMHYSNYLRNHVHSVHHGYSAPFAWSAGWVHPLEDTLAVSSQVIPALLFCHPLTRWCFCILWTVLLIDEHSGHDVWWSPFNWLIPDHKTMGGGADPHDIHHYIPTKNFALIFCLWDRMFDTFEAPDPANVNCFVPPFASERRTPEVMNALKAEQLRAFEKSGKVKML